MIYSFRKFQDIHKSSFVPYAPRVNIFFFTKVLNILLFTCVLWTKAIRYRKIEFFRRSWKSPDCSRHLLVILRSFNSLMKCLDSSYFKFDILPHRYFVFRYSAIRYFDFDILSRVDILHSIFCLWILCFRYYVFRYFAILYFVPSIYCHFDILRSIFCSRYFVFR